MGKFLGVVHKSSIQTTGEGTGFGSLAANSCFRKKTYKVFLVQKNECPTFKADSLPAANPGASLSLVCGTSEQISDLYFAKGNLNIYFSAAAIGLGLIVIIGGIAGAVFIVGIIVMVAILVIRSKRLKRERHVIVPRDTKQDPYWVGSDYQVCFGIVSFNGE